MFCFYEFFSSNNGGKQGGVDFTHFVSKTSSSQLDRGSNTVQQAEELAKTGKAEYGGLINERTDPIVLRLKGAIHKKYLSNLPQYYKNGMKRDEVFILAVNSYLFDDGMHPEQIILQLFFDMGNQVVLFSKDPNINQGEGALREDRKEARSLKGDSIRVGLFQSNMYEEISAVLFSQKDIYNLERREEIIGSDAFLIINPYAKNSISPEDFDFLNVVTLQDSKVKFERSKHLSA
ncbi:MAG: hypothetical protein KBD29_04640 [Candidatus Magasanikbacteria bacterium]|nr:hypothetical protein [Candidatus Magasanikbacteria bacterium]